MVERPAIRGGGEGEGASPSAADHQSLGAVVHAGDLADACEGGVHDLVEPLASHGGDHARREALPVGAPGGSLTVSRIGHPVLSGRDRHGAHAARGQR
jgi:hypothetical protein